MSDHVSAPVESIETWSQWPVHSSPAGLLFQLESMWLSGQAGLLVELESQLVADEVQEVG